MTDTRVSWEKYFMNIAQEVSSRSTCDRKHVGAVIVRDVGHEMHNDHCIRTIHAEANAIVQAAKHGINIDQSEIYITASPCFDCFKLIANVGIGKIYFGEFYRDERIIAHAKSLKIDLIDLSKN